MSFRSFRDIDTDVADIIGNWGLANITSIIRAYSQKGGWEGWAQVEIASRLEDEFQRRSGPASAKALDALIASTTTVSREVPIYPPTLTASGRTSQKKADIVVGFGPPSGREYVLIELKCEGYHNKDAFINAVRDDIDKVNGDIREGFKPAKVWVLGFSASNETYEMLSRGEMPSIEGPIHHMVLYPRLTGGPRLSPYELKLNPRIVLWIFEKDVLKQ